MLRPRLIFTLLVTVPFVTYSSGLQNGFVWDDHKVIESGHLIRSLKNIPTLFYHDAAFNSRGESYEKSATLDTYRPLTLLTFFLEYAAFGLRAGWYHLVSISTHVGCVVLLYLVALQLGAVAPAALFGALLFATHPSIGEAVHWVNGRSDPLSFLFFLSGLLFWLRGRIWLAVPFFVAATLCKETAFILIATVPLLYPLATKTSGKGALLWLSGLLGFLLGFALRMIGLKRTALSGGAAHIGYAAKRVLPLSLDSLISLIRPKAELPPSLFEKYQSLTFWHMTLSAIVILLLSWFFWRRRKTDPVGVWFFFAALALWSPVCLLTFQEGWFGWGRYLYASAGLLATWLAVRISSHAFATSLLQRRSIRVAAGAILFFLAGQTFLAGHDWKNDRTFAEGIVLDHPSQSMGYSELAVVELHDGHPDRAILLLEKAISIHPQNHFHWSRAADALMKLGRREQAFAAAQKALKRDPADVGARYITSIALLGSRQEVPAARMLLGAVLDDPDQQGPWTTLKQALTHLGPSSAFASEVRAAAADPRFAAIRQRLSALP